MNIRLVLPMILLAVASGCAAPGSPPSPSPSPLASPPPTPSPSASAPAIGTPGPQPPNAVLTVAGSPPTIGELGTYTWRGTGSDAPWLPGTPVRAAAGAAATVVLVPPVAVTRWSVKEAMSGDRDGTTAREVASGSGAITFTVPAQAGSLVVEAEFAETGGGSYFWALSPG